MGVAGSKQKGWWRSTGVLQQRVHKRQCSRMRWNYLLGQVGRLMMMVMQSLSMVSMVFSPGWGVVDERNGCSDLARGFGECQSGNGGKGGRGGRGGKSRSQR